MRKVLVSVLLFFGCSNELVKKDINDQINSGELVTVEDLDEKENSVYVNGRLIGTIEKSLIVDCFGNPNCVGLDEERRAVWNITSGNLGLYCLDCTGVTYMSNVYWDYLCNYFDECDQFCEDCQNEPGLQSKIDDYCMEFPEHCIECYPEECNQ